MLRSMIPANSQPIFHRSTTSAFLILKSLFSVSTLIPSQCEEVSKDFNQFSGAIQDMDLLERAPNGNLLVLDLIDRGAMEPDFKLYVELLKRCTDQRNRKTCQMVHSHFLHSKFRHHVYLQNIVINVCVKCGDLDLAHKVFDEMIERDTASYNTLISGYSQINKFKEALSLYIDLMKANLHPNEITFSSVLKSAAVVQSGAMGSKIQATCIKCGCEKDASVGNALVNMYGKAGRIEDAKKVFHQLVKKDVISWTSMLNAYSRHGFDQEAVNIFEEMCAVGLHPNKITFSSVLKSAAAIQSDATGSKIHGTCIKCGCEKNVYVGSALVDMYSKVGRIEDAENVFHQLVKKDVVSWTSMLHAYADHGLDQEALDIFEEMRSIGLQPNEITFSSSLTSAAGMLSDAMGCKIHGICIKCGCEKNIYVGNALVDMYGKVGSIEDAKKVFHRLVKKDVVSWTSMLNAYSHHGLDQEAVDIFEEMCSVGLPPNEITFSSALRSAAGIQSGAVGSKIHVSCIKCGCENNVYVGSALVDMYGKVGNIEDATKVFHQLVERDVVSCTSMLHAYAQHGLGKEAIDLFEEMHSIGLQPNEITFSSALKSAACMQNDAKGGKIHGICIKCGCEKNEYVGNALVDMYGKAGKIEDAEKVFHRLANKDLVSWNSMLHAYAHHGLVHEATDLFDEMRSAGMQPDEITFSSSLKSAAGMQSSAMGSKIHGACIKCGCEKDVSVGNALVDMYGKVGRIEDAKKVFHQMVKKDLVSWNLMLHTLADHGLGQETVDLFEEMRTVGLVPNEITFSSVLTACNHAGVVEKGLYYFELMRKYKLQPGNVHIHIKR